MIWRGARMVMSAITQDAARDVALGARSTCSWSTLPPRHWRRAAHLGAKNVALKGRDHRVDPAGTCR